MNVYTKISIPPLVGAILLLVVGSCSLPMESRSKGTSDAVKPVTVSYQPSATGGITSLELTVEKKTRNLRMPTKAPQSQQYRMYQKIIDGVVYVRIDRDILVNGETKQRSIVTDGNATYLFDPLNEGAAERILAEAGTDDPPSTSGVNLSKRIPDLAKRLQRLSLRSFQLRETQDKKTTEATWVGQTPMSADRTLVKRSLQFDIANSVLAQETTVVLGVDGVKTIESVTYRYADTPEGPVVAQKTTTTTVDYPYTLDTADRTLPRVDSLAGVSTISDPELDALRAQGALVYQTTPLIGDPADPDEVTETTETYTQITVNQTDDKLFRVALQ